MSVNLDNIDPGCNQGGFLLPSIPADSSIKVSIAMITYNHESYIAQAIESVLSQQTNFIFELVISDDYSIDKTRLIVKEYKSKYPDIIRLLLPDYNLGMLPNFINTLAACQGEYVALLEGDDYWTSCHKLQKQVDFLDQHKDHSICFHKVLCCYEDNSKKPYIFPSKKPELCSSLEDLLTGNFMSTCSVVYRNRLFYRIPSWYFDLKLGDWSLHILNAEHGRIGFLDEVMGVYRIHGGGVWSMKKHSESIANCIAFLEIVDTYFQYKYSSIIDFSISNWRLELLFDEMNSISTNMTKRYSLIILRNPRLSIKYLSVKRYVFVLLFYMLLSIKSLYTNKLAKFPN